MIKVRFKKNYKEYLKGDKVELSNNEAFGLIDSGIATKEIRVLEYRSKVVMPSVGKRYKTKGR